MFPGMLAGAKFVSPMQMRHKQARIVFPEMFATFFLSLFGSPGRVSKETVM